MKKILLFILMLASLCSCEKLSTDRYDSRLTLYNNHSWESAFIIDSLKIGDKVFKNISHGRIYNYGVNDGDKVKLYYHVKQYNSTVTQHDTVIGINPSIDYRTVPADSFYVSKTNKNITIEFYQNDFRLFEHSSE